MKTNILITKIESWGPFLNQQGKEMSGVSAFYMSEDFDYQKVTIKEESLSSVQKASLPALFEAEVNPVAKNVNGKPVLKYEIKSLKFLNSVKVF